jgi:hypothetical protein
MLKNLTSTKKHTSQVKFIAISRQFSPASLLGVSAGNCLRVLVDESGMIRTQMETHNRSLMLAVHGTPRVIPRRNSKSTNTINEMCIHSS